MIVPATATRIVLNTAASREEADTIARALVERRLAACVNIVPGVVSVYRWQGQMEHTEELLLVIKTTAERLEEVERLLGDLHSYEIPELLVLEPVSGSRSYLEWLSQETGGERGNQVTAKEEASQATAGPDHAS